MGECQNPREDLDSDELAILWLFKNSSRQFSHGAFGGRIALDMPAVESAARAMGIPWCEYTVMGLNACAEAVIEYEKASREE